MLKVTNLTKTFDTKGLGLLKDLSFELGRGETLCLCGPSGAGKTTLCQMIMGEVAPDSGDIQAPEKTSYIPQELTLNESLSVFENIAAPLRVYITDENDVHHKVRDMIELFGLPYLDHKMPRELSTGQRQRVEIAKALVTDPDMVILDEPFSNLDPMLKDELKLDLFPILKKRDCSLLIVTHDLDDVFSLADHVMVLAEGNMKQWASPHEIYFNPKCSFVARFSGKINLLAGHVISKKGIDYHLKVSLGEFVLKSQREDIGTKFAYLAFRPDAITIHPEGTHKGEVINTIFCGRYQEVWLKGIDKNKIIIHVSSKEKIDLGAKIRFNLSNEDIFLLPI